MNEFVNICKKTQEQLKDYISKSLKEQGYEVINKPGFVYAKGEIPVLLIAHLDTVHRENCIEIWEVDGKITSPQGIGGDDRCGVYIIMQIIDDLKCSVLFCEDEEIGGLGAKQFTKTEYIKNLDVNYIIEFDRKGSKDAVFYDCDNDDFTTFITETTGFKETYGTFSDISIIAPVAKIAAVNLSSGYYRAHTTDEYVVPSEMKNTIEVAKKLINTPSEKFEYIEAKHSWSWKDARNYDYVWDDWHDFDYEQQYINNTPPTQTKRDSIFETEIYLEVIWFDEITSREMVDTVSGNTKAEAWMTFFLYNKEVCYNDVIEYHFY